MGYSTEFKGTLKFDGELVTSQLRYLKSILGEDVREHKEWWGLLEGRAEDLTYIDLELTPEWDGLRWSGAEKTYDLTEKTNLVIELMQQKWPNFVLTGQLEAQGEELDDRWIIAMVDGRAVHQDVAIVGKIVRCPDCGHKFELGKES